MAVEMKDRDGKPFTVDDDLYELIKNRQVWTDPASGHLMVEDMRKSQKGNPLHYLLAVWWYRIMSPYDLPMDILVGFRDNNPRNITYYPNLVRLQRKEVTRHDSNTTIPENCYP